MWISVMRCGLIHPVQMHLGSVCWVERELDPFFPFLFTPPQSSFSWNQCFATLPRSGQRTSCVLPSSLFAHMSTGWVPVRRHLRVVSWCCYWVGDWCSVGTVVLISCDVQSGGGVGRDEGLLMSGRWSLTLLGLHVSCVSMLAVWGQICVQFTERIF